MGRLDGEVNNLTSMVSEQQKVMNEIQEMLAAMHTCSEKHTSTHSSERVESSHQHGEGERFSGRFNSGQWGSNGSIIPKVSKLDFPHFNGMEDPTSWVCRAKQFFKFQKIPTEEQLPLVAYHFEGEAQLWYQLLKDEGEELTLTTLKERLYTSSVSETSDQCMEVAAMEEYLLLTNKDKLVFFRLLDYAHSFVY